MQPLLNTPLAGFEIQPESPRAGLIIVHGLAEHSARYHELARSLAARHIAVFAFDQRGHGDSTGVRTHVAEFEQFVDDAQAIGHAVSARYPALPLYVWGHSMGAVVATLLASRAPAWLRGVITSSHSLDVFSRGLDPARALSRLASRLLPRVRIRLGLDGALISSDDAVQREYVGDNRIPATASLRLIVEFALACRRCAVLASSISEPWLVLHGEDDAIAPARGSQTLFEKLGSIDKQLVIYPGARHEVHNERAPLRDAFLARLSDWVLEHASQGSSSSDRSELRL